MPSKADLEKYECRHGLGYTVITGKRNGLLCEQTALVPLGCTAEVTRVKFRNETDKEKRNSPSSPLWSSFCGTRWTT